MVRSWIKHILAVQGLLLLVLLGCGNPGEDSHHRKNAAIQPAAAGRQRTGLTRYDPAAFPLASHLNQTYTDDLDGLVKRRYIRVLTTFNKTNFFIAGSRIYGFEYSLLQDYIRSLNEGIGSKELRVTVEFIPVPYDQLIPRLVEGLGDIAAAGLTITPERQRRVDFTIPYLTVDELVVTNRATRGLKVLEDLSGRNVYVRRSSSYYESLVTLNRKFAESKIPPVHILQLDESLETEDVFELVHSGAIPITIADSDLAEIWSPVFNNLQVHANLKVRTGGRIAWMVRKENPELRKSLNKFIRTHRKGTLLGNIYFERYFKNNKWIRNPLTRQELEKQHRYTSLFKKYGKKYKFDWMLLMALAYQESNLNNRKRSHTGAVGIMQIRPATAADKHVNIRDINLLENNVHAGVKYLAFLRDRYYSDPTINNRDRIRFSLAAYNAGPKKIRKARQLAEQMGLDRDRWFRNVEIATLRLVGQEPVQYVSNINKYYVLFKLHEELKKLRQSNMQDPLLTRSDS